jgi:hypothetical protein
VCANENAPNISTHFGEPCCYIPARADFHVSLQAQRTRLITDLEGSGPDVTLLELTRDMQPASIVWGDTEVSAFRRDVPSASYGATGTRLHRGALKWSGEGCAGLQPPQTQQNRNLKSTDFVGTMISDVYVISPSAEISH